MKTTPAAILFLLAAALAPALGAHPGRCGYQCSADADCHGCGSSGTCSCPDAANPVVRPAISCSCVDKPTTGVPTEPTANVSDSVWPSQWSAAVTATVYGDFSNKTAIANGKFYYDGLGDRTRCDWTPYTNGKDATQIWITENTTKGFTSRYYVKSGPICIYFPITDPGTHQPVGVERPDWMANCDKMGLASYEGREEVTVDSVEAVAEWADHWSCHLEYTQVNQSITFQNWHSLGLGGLPKGLPLRVTGGNSAPSPTKGSPRLSTVWYSDFQLGPTAFKDSDFAKPGWFCIPVGLEATRAFFGGDPRPSHTFDGGFHQRASELLEQVTAGLAAPPCCEGACEKAGEEKYWSIASGIFGKKHCGECCMPPSKYNEFHFFEKNLTKAETASPCDKRGFTKYDSTVTHGFGPVSMTLDLYDQQ